MQLRRTSAALALGLSAALTTTLAGPAAAATSEDLGLSTPREDSYYPAYGDPGVDTLHYGLDLDWNRGKRLLRGVADIRLRATGTADHVQLDLNRTMTVTAVSVDGVPALFSHPGRHLVIDSPVVADQRYDVRVTYRGTPRPVPAPTTRGDFSDVGMRVARDGQLWTMQEPFGALTWYPVNDQPSDKALYDITVSAPRDWVGVSNGTLVSRTRTERRTTTSWQLQHPTASYLTTLAVGPYAHRRDTGPHGLPLHFWLPRGEVARYMKGLQHVGADLRWLEARLGRYPFESAGAVVVPAESAMETQTLVTFGSRSWGDALSGRETMVHELAHQWYGDTVTPSDWRDLWMNEGMAMYLEAQWASQKTSMRWRDWISYFKWSNTYDRREQGGPGAYDRGDFATSCVYTCTALMYDKLRLKLGDETFWRVVRRWPQQHPDSSSNRQQFVSFVEDQTGRELSGFFRDWLNSRTWPPA
ncbi:M1 family metallopeptidase [Nocardioides mesophilus]|uniref:Aminopeptidase N n=1 Tax=Nocardioides mesophilus TaxID=433659 RepID=A0A7G9R8Y2_9ACTN|nr:M1 family metallopeptidase [Nocardioides mesophilus]QNN52057.1 M1 family metallopeptidase [Nocardioides mesophilus]